MAITLLCGAIFIPTYAKASLLSSLLGTRAFADLNTVSLPQIGSNSQTIGLLEANVSSASVLDNSKAKKSESGTTSSGNSDSNNIISDNSLLPATGPLGVSDGTDVSDPTQNQTSVYVIRNGDNIAGIAKMFGVSANTILWENDLKKGDKLVEGTVIFILPVSGLEHTVAKGQTLQSIAKLYKADVNDILQYNDVTLDAPLVVGDKLIIPDGEKAEVNDKPIKNLAASVAKDKKYYEKHPTKNIGAYFIDPVPGYRKSQGIHDNNGVDLAIATGTPIHAAAAGRVTLAREGYNGGFGYLVIISHPNGTETLYAHQSNVIAHTGQEVSQGEVIGYVGSTGHSTGPHLHFEVHGARNPGADGSWKY